MDPNSPQLPPNGSDLFASPALPPEVVPNKKPKNKLLIIVIAAVVLLLILVVAAALVPKKKSNTNTTTTTPSAEATKAVETNVTQYLQQVGDHNLDAAYSSLNSQKVPKQFFTDIAAPKLGINFKLSECKVQKTEQMNTEYYTTVSCPYYKQSKQAATLTFTSHIDGDKAIIDIYTIT